MKTFSVNQLAEMTQKIAKKIGYNVTINYLEYPRKEAEEHYYNPSYQGLLGLGVKPHYLTDKLMERMTIVVGRYKINIRKEVIFKGIKW